MSNLTLTSTGTPTNGSVQTVDQLNGSYPSDIARDITQGLLAKNKYIPSKYFYDTRGSKLFEDICRLPEYYPTRTEVSILKEIAPELAPTLSHKDIVELGSGADWKIRILLDAIDENCRATICYIPVDISQTAILQSSASLAELYPELDVMGIIADFTAPMFHLPSERPKLFCFLGSTIGNLNHEQSIAFLKNIAAIMKTGDSLMIGFDMIKPVKIMEAAYNDAAGVTAEFNRNVLRVINHELGGNFDPNDFGHLAFFNPGKSRIEMHLLANCDCAVRLEVTDMNVEISRGEAIHTENSRKFTPEAIEHMASLAGLAVRDWYADPQRWFSLVIIERQEGTYFE